MAKKPISIFKRQAAAQPKAQKRVKKQKIIHDPVAVKEEQPLPSKVVKKASKEHRQADAHHGPVAADARWTAASIVDSQAAYAVGRLLDADSKKRHGASIKSLTLAPHVQNKQATHAVTCQTLQHRSLLQPIIEDCKILEDNSSLTAETALVLVYEVGSSSHLVGAVCILS